MKEEKIHKSVMVDEAIAALHVKNQALYIDATLGTGGHSLEILKKGGRVLGIDIDSEMVKIAEERVGELFSKDKFKFVSGNFTDIDKIAKENEWTEIKGILLDLGVSNLHLTDPMRGFSFGNPEAPLDMRLNPETQGVKASDLLNVLRPDQLEEMFSAVLEGGPARWLTGRVIYSRENSKIETVEDFLEICDGLKTGKTGLSEATLPFLALRIAVNSELDNLNTVLPKAYELLETGGRLVVISFHSGEDKIVKEFMHESEVITPSTEEIYKNPRARSAKIRIIQKNAKK